MLRKMAAAGSAIATGTRRGSVNPNSVGKWPRSPNRNIWIYCPERAIRYSRKNPSGSGLRARQRLSRG